jgi:hypothetical protein
MFEFDCVMMWLNSHPLLVVQRKIQTIWKCGDVSVLRLSLEISISFEVNSNMRVSVGFFEILHCSILLRFFLLLCWIEVKWK